MLLHIVYMNLHNIQSFHQKWGQVHPWSQGDHSQIPVLQSHVPPLSISKQSGRGGEQRWSPSNFHSVVSASTEDPSLHSCPNKGYKMVTFQQHYFTHVQSWHSFSFINQNYLVLPKYSSSWEVMLKFSIFSYQLSE